MVFCCERTQSAYRGRPEILAILQQPKTEPLTSSQQMSLDKEHLYLISCFQSANQTGSDIWNPRPEGFFSNIVFLGGTMSNSPSRNEALRRYGIMESPILEAVDNKNVFIDVTNAELYAQYATEHLGRPVKAVETGSNPLAPYQLVTDVLEEDKE